jgi:hypothetical protein
VPHENSRTAKTGISREGGANMSRQSPGEGNVVENDSLAQHETAEELQLGLRTSISKLALRCCRRKRGVCRRRKRCTPPP